MHLPRANWSLNQRNPMFPEREVARRTFTSAPDDPPLGVYDRCRHVLGGSILLVVDLSGDDLVVALKTEAGISEHTVRRECVRREPAGG